jgi:hypothetical protein
LSVSAFIHRDGIHRHARCQWSAARTIEIADRPGFVALNEDVILVRALPL